MVYYFTNWKIDYNKKYTNVTMNLSLYENNSRQNPSQEFPGLEMWYFKDFSYLEVSCHFRPFNIIILIDYLLSVFFMLVPMDEVRI